MRLLRRLSYLWHRRRREQDLADEIAWHRALAERETSRRRPAARGRAACGQRPHGERDAGARSGAPRLGSRRTRRRRPGSALRLSRPEAQQDAARRRLPVAGLSTGFGTALFSVVNAVVLQPVSALRPASLVRFWIGNGNRISWLNLRDLCETRRACPALGYRMDELPWQHGDEPVRILRPGR